MTREEELQEKLANVEKLWAEFDERVQGIYRDTETCIDDAKKQQEEMLKKTDGIVDSILEPLIRRVQDKTK